MKIKSLSDIPEALFYPVKQWVEADPVHLNILVAINMLLFIISIIAYMSLSKRIGRPDERTNAYYRNFAFAILIGLLVCEMIFPKTYMPYQVLAYKYAIALLVGDLYLFIQYKKDFS